MDVRQPRLALGPEDTPWYPREDRNYSSWQSMFDEKIDTYCQEPGSFENGVTVFSNSASKSLFGTLRSQSGIDSLSRAIEEESFGSYIGGKGGLIAFIVISFIVFVLSIALAFSLKKCFRDKFRKCGGACNDRPRCPPHHLKGRKPTIFKWISVFGLLAMIAIAIVCFVYSANLSYGKNSLACDFWTTMRGHYFGATEVRASSEVSRDWKGSHPQWEAMTLLKNTVNPRPDQSDARRLQETESPNLPICPMCEHIVQVFNGTGDSLVNVLSGSRDKVMDQSFAGAVFVEALAQYISKFAWLDLNVKNEIEVYWKNLKNVASNTGPMKLQFGFVVPAMLKTYASELDETTNHGISLFEENLDFYLGRESMMLESSFQTADNSAISLGDIDWVMAKMVVMWDSSVWPLVSTLLTVVIAISCILGILAVFFAAGGTAVFFKLNKHIRTESTPPAKLTTCLGVTYVILLVFSGFSFFMSSVLFFAGNAGSDGCGFVEQVAFEEGNWGIFPPALLNETVTGQTDVPTVLDTCVKQTGDGDVAASLGIKMFLDKLSQTVSVTEASLLQQVATELDLDFKNLKTNSLADMTKTAGVLVHGDRPYMTVSANYYKEKITEEFVNTGVDQVFPWVGQADIAHLTAMDGLFSGAGGAPAKPMDLLNYLAYWLRDLFPNAVSSEKAWKVLNDLVAEASKTGKTDFDRICAPYLAKAEVCSDDDTNDKKIYVLRGLPNTSKITEKTTSIPPLNNPFADKRFQDFLKVFMDDKQKLLTAIQITATIMQNDWVHHSTMSDFMQRKSVYSTVTFSPLNEAPQSVQDLFKELGDDTGKVYIEKVIQKFLPELKCAATYRAEDEEHPATVQSSDKSSDVEEQHNGWFGLWRRRLDVADFEKCTLPEVLTAFNEYNTKLSATLLDAFTLANDGIINFVEEVTIGSFENLLRTADENLENFNCQFVGTSMKEGVVAGLCDVVMPSVVALGLSGIFLWVFSGLGAFMTWKIYHYYRDLEILGETFDGNKLSEIELDEAASHPEKQIVKDASYHSQK